MKRLIILVGVGVLLSCGGRSAQDTGGTVLDEAVVMGANTAANRIVSFFKPSQNTGVAFLKKLFSQGKFKKQQCPNGGFVDYLGGDQTDADMDFVEVGSAYQFFECVIYIPVSDGYYYYDVWLYLDGVYINEDNWDNDPYKFQYSFVDMFLALFVQDPLNPGSAFFFGQLFDTTITTVMGYADSLNGNLDWNNGMAWGYMDDQGNAQICEYMYEDGNMSMDYMPADSMYDPGAEEDAYTDMGGYYIFSYENYQDQTGCGNLVDSLSADVEVSTPEQLYDDTQCEYDFQNNQSNEYSQGALAIRDRISNAYGQINYGSNCQASTGSGKTVRSFGNNVINFHSIQKKVLRYIESKSISEMYSVRKFVDPSVFKNLRNTLENKIR